MASEANTNHGDIPRILIVMTIPGTGQSDQLTMFPAHGPSTIGPRRNVNRRFVAPRSHLLRSISIVNCSD